MAGAIASDGPTEEEHSVPLKPWMRFVHVHYAVNAVVSATALAVTRRFHNIYLVLVLRTSYEV